MLDVIEDWALPTGVVAQLRFCKVFPERPAVYVHIDAPMTVKLWALAWAIRQLEDQLDDYGAFACRPVALRADELMGDILTREITRGEAA